MNYAHFLIIGTTALSLAACTSPDGTANQTGTGALIGGLTGAAIGKAVGDDDKSVAIGAGVGALVGGAIGANLDDQEAELRRSMAGSGADIRNDGQRLTVILPESVTFATDSSVVNPAFRPALARVSDSLARYRNSTVRVVGHTDNVGTAAYNQQLSEDRALSVARILIGNGTSSSRISYAGRGFNEPVASNSTAAGRAQNRRVEIIITPTR
jgi:outer membrane protein OmpA-like peptidoglycan-associated protein